MQERVRSWFTGAHANDNDEQQPKQPSASLLAEWKAYTGASSSRPDGSASSQTGLDLEASSVPESLAPLFRSANETLLGTFNIVSKGVRDLPGNVQSAASSLPSGKALLYFGMLLATGIFFIFIALIMFLPVMVVMPRKFAICFTLGCLFIILSFFALKGPKNQLLHMASKEVHLFPSMWEYGHHYHTEYADDGYITQYCGVEVDFNQSSRTSHRDQNPIEGKLGHIGKIQEIMQVDLSLFQCVIFFCKWDSFN